ncbi:M20/M25/M40 family metallo-hydrolase [Fusibacter ferrireducens]|uniref:M20/M25/M40 family metallo-hydrolase n=1 Tax=Fusibacter ferrireducens TaxID=2785058 RepID=A0ABR9ZNS1_9FIRM|nr:M20/M25/M40 family metallo-hydrolase [Fusibacter ferrireducens]MBF4692120.1 M20/M25/M40 family metallo-hydrolase [Fusibacter ferrireducens]
MNMEKIHAYLESNKEEFLEIFKRLVRQPSVSKNYVDICECAKTLKDIMDELGIKGEICKKRGNPVVLGEVRSKNVNAKTILFYGHYDVQPVDPIDLWHTLPFEPSIRNERLYGRGSADNKGQLLTHLFAVKAYLQLYGDIPVHVKFIFEGEEEIGSPYLLDFIKANRDKLKSDIVYISDGPMDSEDINKALFGSRGIISMELNIETALYDNHSGSKGGVIKNAAWEMVKLLQSMVNEHGEVLIDGFYENVRARTDHDLELIEKLNFEPTIIAKAFGVEKIEMTKEAFYTNLMYRPTLTINGICSGYTEEGSKSVIPKAATAKIEVRLVCDQSTNEIFQKVERHVKKVNSNATISMLGRGMEPSRSNADSPIVKQIMKAVSAFSPQEPTLVPSSGASLPNYIWASVMETPFIIVPYGNIDEHNHSPNENMKISLFDRGMHISAQAIHNISTIL